MEEDPENGKESSHSAHANGINCNLNVVVANSAGKEGYCNSKNFTN